jgi:hypothetical protein
MFCGSYVEGNDMSAFRSYRISPSSRDISQSVLLLFIVIIDCQCAVTHLIIPPPLTVFMYGRPTNRNGYTALTVRVISNVEGLIGI